MLEQDRRTLAPAGSRGAVQRMHADLVVGECVHVRSVLDEQESRFGPVEEGRIVEGGEVVARTGLRQRRICSEKLSQAGDVSERGSLEDVELCGLRQPAGSVVVATVE